MSKKIKNIFSDRESRKGMSLKERVLLNIKEAEEEIRRRNNNKKNS